MARMRLAKLHRRVARVRADFQHKTSRRLVYENQALIFETLRIKNMMKNHHLAGAIADVGWGEFMRQCEYKAKQKGKVFVKIGAFFASSKTCSACGHRLQTQSFATCDWRCPHVHHDRDANASLNIKQEGVRMPKTVEPTICWFYATKPSRSTSDQHSKGSVPAFAWFPWNRAENCNKVIK